MEKKQFDTGADFYFASSVQDFESGIKEVKGEGTIVLLNVSLQAIPDPPEAIGTAVWYELSDSSGTTNLRWPLLYWDSDESGLSDEMRSYGRFFAQALELEYSDYVDPNIVRIIRNKTGARKRPSLLERLWEAVPSFAGARS